MAGDAHSPGPAGREFSRRSMFIPTSASEAVRTRKSARSSWSHTCRRVRNSLSMTKTSSIAHINGYLDLPLTYILQVISATPYCRMVFLKVVVSPCNSALRSSSQLPVFFQFLSFLISGPGWLSFAPGLSSLGFHLHPFYSCDSAEQYARQGRRSRSRCQDSPKSGIS